MSVHSFSESDRMQSQFSNCLHPSPLEGLQRLVVILRRPRHNDCQCHRLAHREGPACAGEGLSTLCRASRGCSRRGASLLPSTVASMLTDGLASCRGVAPTVHPTTIELFPWSQRTSLRSHITTITPAILQIVPQIAATPAGKNSIPSQSGPLSRCL